MTRPTPLGTPGAGPRPWRRARRWTCRDVPGRGRRWRGQEDGGISERSSAEQYAAGPRTPEACAGDSADQL